MPEDGFYPERHKQLFQLKGRCDAEHAVAIETAVRHKNVAMGIMSDEVAKRLHGDDGAGDGVIFGNRLLEKDLQGFPGVAAEIGEKLPVVQKVTTQDLRDADTLKGRSDEMPVRNLLEYVVVEIKMDSDVSDENKAKLRYSKEHFARVNELQKEQRYYFKFLSPGSYDLFFKALREKTYKNFRSELEAKLEE